MASAPEGLFFFFHIPKTAGTTLNRVFEANIPAERILSVYDAAGHERLRGLDEGTLDGLTLIQGHVFVHDWSALFEFPRPVSVFTFLREPVDRVVSEYRFLKTWPGQHLYEFMNREDIGLEEYVSGSRPELVYRGRNTATCVLSGIDANAKPEEALDTAMRHLAERFAMFGLIERFDESLVMIKDLMGLDNVLYERRNVGAPGPKPDPKELEAVAEANQVDAELHRRASALFEERVRVLGPDFARKVALFRKVNEKMQKVSALLMRRAGQDPDQANQGK